MQLLIYVLRLFIGVFFQISLAGKRRKGEKIGEPWYSHDVVQSAYFQQGKLPVD